MFVFKKCFIYCTLRAYSRKSSWKIMRILIRPIRTASHNAYDVIRTTVYLKPLAISLRYTLQLALQAKIELCTDQSYFYPCVAHVRHLHLCQIPLHFHQFYLVDDLILRISLLQNNLLHLEITQISQVGK